MTDSPDIGGRSRQFQATVIALTLLALLAGALAAASLSGNGDILDLGSNSGGEPVGDSVDGSGGSGSGGSGGGGTVPGFVEDIFGWIGDDGDPGDVEPGEIEVPPPPYDITVEPEPTPGARVVVTVEKNGNPVPFALVSFNGEAIGRTAPTGQIPAQVPYTDELRVTAAPPGVDGGGGGGGSGSNGPSGTPTHLGVGALVQTAGSNSSVTYDVRTNATARVDGVALPGETATVRFVVAGAPLPGVGVISNGEGVGITDRNGTVEFEIPSDAPLGGSVPVELVRGEFADNTEVEVADIKVSLDTGLLALPSTGATAEVTAVDSTASEPLTGVPVAVGSGGERVTGENGTASFTLPWSNSVTVTATTGYGTVSTTTRGILLQFAGAVVALLIPVVGAAVWVRGNPATRRRLRERVIGAILAAGRLLDGTARRVATAVRNLPVGDTVGRLWGGLARVVAWLRTGVGRLGAGLFGVVTGLRGRSLLAGPRWLLARLRAGLAWLAGVASQGKGSTEQRTHGGESSETPTTEGDTTGQEPQSAYNRLRRYWLWLVGRVVGRTAGRTKTPVEIERRAVKQGLPADAVRSLRRAFQAVEYGPADAEERVDDAESAQGQLQHEREEDSEANT